MPNFLTQLKQPRARRRIHILKEGTWPSTAGPIVVDRQKMLEVFSGFSPALFKPPVIITHALPPGETERSIPTASDIPLLSESVAILDPRGMSYGTPVELTMDRDGVWAEFDPSGLSNAALSWVKGNNLLSVSPGLYRPTDTGNPTPGKWALRHIALLGSDPPAQKGLHPLHDGLFMSEQKRAVCVVHRPLTLKQRLNKARRDYYLTQS